MMKLNTPQTINLICTDFYAALKSSKPEQSVLQITRADAMGQTAMTYLQSRVCCMTANPANATERDPSLHSSTGRVEGWTK